MADNKVVPFTGITRLDTPPEKVLDEATEAGLENVVIVGWDEDGDLYFASSYAAGPETLWLLAVAQRRLLAMGDPE